MTTNNSFSFKKGWKKLPIGAAANVRVKIMDALGIKAKPNFYARLNGDVEPKVTEAQAIEGIFAEYGIKEVWGE